ncbi:MAG: porin family protein [Richelia sp. RM2_1_2]|nr:porin family protein [Richelia sp. SM2_1_7]NJN07748.1 porin family protein [Richelia sp. RM1_1_1]NJO57780.1 porin family protein [Richelia sp. RM2_1_2]
MKVINLAISLFAATSVILSGGIAAAQTGMDGSYIGAGIAAGATSGGQGNDDALFGGNVQGRYAIPQTPVSARGAILFGGDATAIMPMLTIDSPIADNTNLYFGAGYSWITNEGDNTPLGNRNAAVITLGAESEVSERLIVYGDAKWGINAYENSSADAVSFQTGVGYRF